MINIPYFNNMNIVSADNVLQNDDVSSLNSSIATIESNISDLQSSVSNLGSLSESVSSLESQISQINTSIESVNSEIGSISSLFSSSSTYFECLTASKTSASSTISTTSANETMTSYTTYSATYWYNVHLSQMVNKTAFLWIKSNLNGTSLNTMYFRFYNDYDTDVTLMGLYGYLPDDSNYNSYFWPSNTVSTSISSDSYYTIAVTTGSLLFHRLYIMNVTA